MLSAVLLFFGITFVYTGLLVSDRDVAAALSIAAIGLVLLIKPALEVLKYFRANHTAPPRPRRPRSEPRKKPKIVHLKVVKSEDEKPTIH